MTGRMRMNFDLFIGGEFVAAAGQERLPAVNPFNRTEWATIPVASDAQVADTVAAARHAYNTVWRHTNGRTRAQMLHRLAEHLAAQAEPLSCMETTDNGKVIRETHSQINFAARGYEFFAGSADKIFGETIPLDHKDTFDFTRREPLGVVVLVTAWNSPMVLLANKLAPALAAGEHRGD